MVVLGVVVLMVVVVVLFLAIFETSCLLSTVNVFFSETPSPILHINSNCSKPIV